MADMSRAGGLLALDPSSTTTGYAVLRLDLPAGTSAGEVVVEAGLIRPEHRRAGFQERSFSLAAQAVALMRVWRPSAMVVEVPSGKVGSGARRGAGVSLMAYAYAAGEMVGALTWAMAHDPGESGYAPAETVDRVDDRTWTNGRPKPERLAVLRSVFPAYAAAAEDDGGGDAGDAILLGLWWRGRYLGGDGQGAAGGGVAGASGTTRPAGRPGKGRAA